jgi:hypothetical protein
LSQRNFKKFSNGCQKFKQLDENFDEISTIFDDIFRGRRKHIKHFFFALLRNLFCPHIKAGIHFSSSESRIMDTINQRLIHFRKPTPDFNRKFYDLYRQKSMVDVTLSADGHFLQVHKVVLAVASSWFQVSYGEIFTDLL